MDRDKFMMYVYELDNMTKYSIMSFNSAYTYLKELDTNPNRENYSENMDAFWYFLQTGVNYSANVSKLLWPSYTSKRLSDGTYKPFNKKIQNYINERLFLRETLGINEESSVKRKKLRNRFEHIDEYMEDHDFILYADRNIGNSIMNYRIEGVSEEEHRKKTFRFYNRVTTELIFYGESMFIKQLFEDMVDIREKVISWKEHNR
ncbi:hypothetical protein BOVMAS19_12900 [Streptococcus uberis]